MEENTASVSCESKTMVQSRGWEWNHTNALASTRLRTIVDSMSMTTKRPGQASQSSSRFGTRSEDEREGFMCVSLLSRLIGKLLVTRSNT